MDLNLEIVLETNIIFVNGIASLVKISKNLEFTMVKYVDNLKKKTSQIFKKGFKSLLKNWFNCGHNDDGPYIRVITRWTAFQIQPQHLFCI